MSINVAKAVGAGLVGTVCMSGFGVWLAPMLGLPRMNPADMLAESLGGQIALGWVGHLLVGAILALIYAAVAGKLPGPPLVRGALFSLAPWLLAQGMSLMTPGGLTAGAAIASLLGHLVYGAIVGAIYGPVPAARPAMA